MLVFSGLCPSNTLTLLEVTCTTKNMWCLICRLDIARLDHVFWLVRNPWLLATCKYMVTLKDVRLVLDLEGY